MSRSVVNIAVFASGTGTNAERLAGYFAGSALARVALIVSNRPDAPVLERARRLGIPAAVFGNAAFAAGDEVLAALVKHGIGFIALAGFLRKIPGKILAAYREKIVNVHPALLPKHGGKGMYGSRVHEAVLAAGERETGITIHHVSEHYDEGDIIYQARCPVNDGDSGDDVASRVHGLEYRHYPEVIEGLIEKDAEVKAGWQK